MFRIEIATFVTSLWLGILASVNPCVMPLYPGYLQYITRKTNVGRFAGFYVVAGVLIFMSIIGAISAYLSVAITKIVGVISPIAFSILLIIGVILLFNIKIPVKSLTISPNIHPFFYGMMYGPLVIPCNAPLVFAIFAFSSSIGSFALQYAQFIMFGIGLGLPLIILSTFTTLQQKLICFLLRYHSTFNRVIGALLIVISLYELVKGFGLLQI